MPVILAKLTAKNQLTLPRRIIERLDNPTHFEVIVSQGALILFPGRIISLERQGKAAGIPPSVLRLAMQMIAEKKAAKKAAQQAQFGDVMGEKIPEK